MKPIYLDNNATTACDPAVVEAMLPYFTEQFGNASSMHSFGNKVAQGLKEARVAVQKLIGAEHDTEIIFTSCGTESDSTAILSALKAQPERNQIITTVVEHPAILTLCDTLEKDGVVVHRLGVDKKGRLDLPLRICYLGHQPLISHPPRITINMPYLKSMITQRVHNIIS